MGSRDHSIECDVCGESYGGFNGPDEHECNGPRVLSPDEICKRSTWCHATEHPDDVACVEVPRQPIEPTDFGPSRAVKVGWGK